MLWVILLTVLALSMLFVSKGAKRTPQDIFAAVQSTDPEHNPSLQPGAPPAPPGGTWCNKFIAWITSTLGAPVPFGEYGTPADAQIVWLQSGNSNWRQCSEVEANAGALNGKVALATYFNPDGSGHIALVLPHEGPTRIAQAGAHNFNDGLLVRGFGDLPVVFFLHEDEP